MQLKVQESYEIEIGGGATVTGAPLTNAEHTAITARHTKIRKGQEVTNFPAAAKESFRKMVCSWEGVYFGDKPAECNDANKDYMFDHHNDLAGEIMEKLSAARAERREVLEKNSESSPSAS